MSSPEDLGASSVGEPSQSQSAIWFRPRCLFKCQHIRVGCARLGDERGDGIYLYDEATQRRYKLGDCDENDVLVRANVIALTNSESFLVLIGYRKSRKHNSLRIWRYDCDTITPVEFSFASASSSLAGFGFAVQGQGDESDLIYIGTGLGLGIARLWVLKLSSNILRLLAAFKAKSSSILSLLIIPEHRKFILANYFEPCVQEWTFDPFALEPIKHSGKDAIVLVKESKIAVKYATEYPEFVEESRRYQSQDRTHSLIEFIHANAEWQTVFPPVTLDPFVYDGEKDESGLPHGRGAKMTPDGYYFEGEWDHGSPKRGRVTGPSKYEYEGGVEGESIYPHGFGILKKSCGVGLEVYQGGWKGGKCHGLHHTYWIGTNEKNPDHDSHEWGIYREGLAHGLQVKEWGANSPELPFSIGNEAEARKLAPLRCFQVFSNGKYGDEFHFHLASGNDWTPETKQLYHNMEKPNKPAWFAPPHGEGQSCGRSDRPECWACLEVADESEDFVCLGCSMRVHRQCAWPPECFSEKSTKIGGWICLRCDARLQLENRPLVVYDRHGEPVLVESTQDVANLRLNSVSDDEDSPMIVYAMPAKTYSAIL